jgi:hypothetical protein
MVFPVKVLLFSERKERNTNTRSEHRYNKHQHARALKIKRKTAGETKTPFFLFQERVVQADSSARKRDERNFSLSSSSSSPSKAPKKGERIYAQKEDKRPERKTTPRRDV